VLAKLRPKLTYANVVSTLCLFILLGGSSYAAVTLKKNSVKSTNIAKNAVTSPKVKNGSLLSADFKAGQLPGGGTGGPTGPQGSAGAQGQRGETGLPGTDGEGFKWRGPFDCGGSYVKGDVVSYEGSSWVATIGVGDCVQPPNPAWEKMAQKGDTGEPGPFPNGNVPSGTTLRGNYSVGVQATDTGYWANGYSFLFTLSAAPAVHYVPYGSTPPAQCPGTVSSPEAAGGHLCLYGTGDSHIDEVFIINPEAALGNAASRHGFVVRIHVTSAGLAGSRGSWAVTAP
jgi:hypothetical protein